MYQNQNNHTAYVYWEKLNDGVRVSREESSAAGRELLRKALEEIYHLELEKLRIAYGSHGKPYLADLPHIHFNISHSGCYVVCAVSGTEIGIDIQEKRVIALDKIGRKIFSPEEYRAFLKSEEKQELFFRQWVRIESYLKWTGEGISCRLEDLKMDGWSQFLHVDNKYMCAVWSQRPLHIHMKEM